MATIKTNIIARFADAAAIQAGTLTFDCSLGFNKSSILEGLNLSTGDTVFSKSDGALSFTAEKPTARTCTVTLTHSQKLGISPKDSIQIVYSGRGRSGTSMSEQLTQAKQAAVDLASSSQNAATLGEHGCDFLKASDGVVQGNWFSVTCIGNTTFAASTAVVNGNPPPTSYVFPVGLNIVTDFSAICLSGGPSAVIAYRRSREDITNYIGG